MGKPLGDEHALHVAVKNGHLEIVNFLLDRFATADEKNSEGRTPLHIAAEKGDNPILERLLQDLRLNIPGILNARDKSGFSPLHLAAKNGRCAATAELLRSKNIEVNLSNFVQISPMERREGSPKISNRTALAWAVTEGHLDVVNLLLKDHRTDLNIEDSNLKTPLDLAIEGGHVEIFNALRTHKKLDYINSSDLHIPVNFDSLLEQTVENRGSLNAPSRMEECHRTPELKTKGKKGPSLKSLLKPWHCMK